ncbi:MAG: glycosyltransferase family 4 protein [Clostridiales bacterium]|nr:glycosyltransferase family 4 protein [Clostridiales bacterium]
MKICLAAAYDVTSPDTWSGTPYSLYKKLCETDNDITPLNLLDHYSDFKRRYYMLKYMDPLRTIKEKGYASKIKYARKIPLNSDILHKQCKRKDFDVLIEFSGYLPGKDLPPYYIYSDCSHDLSLDFLKQEGHLPFGYKESDLDDVKKAADFSRQVYENASGVFCMSRWMADSMINTSGIDKNKVHIVYAGANFHDVLPKETSDPREIDTDAKEFDLLLTGKNYIEKGVDLAVSAVELLNRECDKKYRLHVCGIKEDFKHDKNVINHGFVDKETLSVLLNKCSLFVLPSRFDCFGISFIEAMSYGLPCIGRNICAMPEIIDEDKNGELIGSDDPTELAEKIVKILSDGDRYKSYSENAEKKSKLFSWDKTVNSMLDVISGR